MDLDQSEYRRLLHVGPLVYDYANYEQGYDQWQIWAKRQQQRRGSKLKSRARSLLSEIVDPSIERHMQIISNTTTVTTKDNSLSDTKMGAISAFGPTTTVTPRRRWHKTNSRRHEEHPQRAGTAEFCPMDERKKKATHYKKDGGSDSSTKATSESDDSSYERVSPFAQSNPIVYKNKQFSAATTNKMHMTHSMILEQEAMICAMDVHPKNPPKPQRNINAPTGAPQSQRMSRGQQRQHEGQVTILPNDRVKRALERGESIRILKCTGCCRELLVKPDLPLVYCPYCECFSELPSS